MRSAAVWVAKWVGVPGDLEPPSSSGRPLCFRLHPLAERLQTGGNAFAAPPLALSVYLAGGVGERKRPRDRRRSSHVLPPPPFSSSSCLLSPSVSPIQSLSLSPRFRFPPFALFTPFRRGAHVPPAILHLAPFPPLHLFFPSYLSPPSSVFTPRLPASSRSPLELEVIRIDAANFPVSERVGFGSAVTDEPSSSGVVRGEQR